MTLKELNKQDEHEQAEVVWDKSLLLADRLSLGFRYLVYQVEDFYVEFRYNMEHNILRGLRAFEEEVELEPYKEQINYHKLNGKPKATLKELRDKAIKVLPNETIETIIDTDEKTLVHLHYSLEVQLRNQLDLWHTEVLDDKGSMIHPDDVSQALIKEIWYLNH